jgi:hypothetical protein
LSLPGFWTAIEGSTRMKQIDTGMTSEVWAVNHNDDVFRLKPDKTWENIEGKIKHVTAGESGIIIIYIFASLHQLKVM